MKPPANRPLKRLPGEPARISRASKDEEHLHQSSLIEWADATRLPDWYRSADVEFIGDVLLAVPMGHIRSLSAGARIRAEGGRAGVPDLFLMISTEEGAALAIEMKSPSGRMAPEQERWRRRLSQQGYAHAICRSVDEGMFAIKRHLRM
jgi:VRR-NUC domain